MESLGIDVKLLIAQIINFALFFYIFRKFIAKPFSSFLNVEKKKEEEKEKVLSDLKKKEENMILQEQKAKEKIKREYELAVKNAKADAVSVREEMLQEAKKDSEQLVERGKKQIDEERITMQKDLKTKVVDLSLVIVNRALSDFLTEDMQKKINERILKNLAKDVK